MSTATKLSIANRALLGVGARAQISSLDPSDGSVEGDAISTLWTPTFEQLGRSAHWNCLTAQVTLTLLQAAQGTPENPSGSLYPSPPTPWLYAYSYPSNCLDMRYVVPSLPVQTGDTTPATTLNNSAGTWIPGQRQIPFVVQTILDTNNTPITVILTNQSQAQASFTANYSNPALWDSMFQAAMVAALGAFLVPALSLNMGLLDRCVNLAEGMIRKARTADGNEGVTSMDHTPDWIQARAGAQGFGYGFYNNGFYNYTDVSWPSLG